MFSHEGRIAMDWFQEHDSEFSLFSEIFRKPYTACDCITYIHLSHCCRSRHPPVPQLIARVTVNPPRSCVTAAGSAGDTTALKRWERGVIFMQSRGRRKIL